MSLNTLLESANTYQSLQSDAARLARKWSKTGLLEGLGNDTIKNNMAMILENQAKQLVTESSQTGGGIASQGHFTAGVGEQWAGIALPLVRKVFGQIAAKEFISVQPMNLPSGLVFFLDFQYGNNKAPFKAGKSLYGDTTSAEQPFGNTTEGGFYGAGRFGYSINNTGSLVSGMTVAPVSAPASIANVNFDSRYSASLANYKTYSVTASELKNADWTGIRGFALTSGGTAINLPQFTTFNGQVVTFVYDSTAGTPDKVEFQLQPTDQYRGDFEDGNGSLNADNEPSIEIPEINIQMKSSAITAKTRKLKAVWTPEFAQDLNAYQNVDAEAELTGMLSEYISLEIDLEILDMLMTNAAAGSEVWSAKNNTSIDGTTGVVTNTLGFYNSQGQWFQTLGTKVQKLSNVIHQKTMRGGANFLVVSPAVSTILESIPGFAASTDGDVSKSTYAFGAQKVGNLNGKYKVYKNPYMTENVILMGYKGNQFLETGAVFAPYIPLIMTPLVYDPETFTPRKGLLTRYAKKMVRPEYYATIKVADLNTI